MKAVILETLNQRLVVDDVELTPLCFGQVLVKNIVSGLCGSQLLEIGGYKGNAKFIPHLLGHEGCGIVQEIGTGVTKVKVGDKVVMHWMKSGGIESPFPSYIFRGKKIYSGKVTTLSEYSIVSENRLTPVQSDSNPELCALLGCSLTTALGTINNETQIKLGDSVLILGCGGVGMNLIMGAKLVGANPIVGADINANKQYLCSKFGTSYFVDLSNPSYFKILKNIFPSGVDIILDTTANVDIINTTLQCLADGGQFIMIGHPKPNEQVRISAHDFFGMKGKTIKTTVGGKTNPEHDIPKYINLYKSGLLKIDNIVTHRYNIDNINDAIETLKRGCCGRIIINI